MRILAITLLFTALVFGQAQEPVKVTPGTPAVKGPAEPAEHPAAAPPQPISPDTVVAEVNGKKMTAAELDKILGSLAPAELQAVRTRPTLLSNVLLIQRLAEDAQKAGLDQKSPYKQELESYRLRFLAQAQMNETNNTMKMTEDEEHKYYNDNPDKFKEVKIRVIKIDFNPNPAKPAPNGKKLPAEAEAKAKIEALAKQIQGGADFGKLARDNSDDEASAAKDGDYGVVKAVSPYPAPIKNAVMALKQGETSAPIREPNAYYLVRADQVSQEPFTDVFAEVTQGVRQAKFQEWMKNLQTQYTVKIENPAYFTPRLPPQLQQVH